MGVHRQVQLTAHASNGGYGGRGSAETQVRVQALHSNARGATGYR